MGNNITVIRDYQDVVGIAFMQLHAQHVYEEDLITALFALGKPTK
jgi:hypothetical protein